MDCHLLNIFQDILLSDKNLALIRTGDGEDALLEGSNRHVMDWTYNEESEKDKAFRDVFVETLRNADKNIYYYCDELYIDNAYIYGIDLSNQYKIGHDVKENDYFTILHNIVNLLQSQENIIIASNRLNINALPFAIEAFCPIADNAGIYTLPIKELIKDFIQTHNVKNKNFLFSAGPLAKILIAELWAFNKDNRYIDIGSSFDIIYGLNVQRLGYASFLKHHKIVSYHRTNDQSFFVGEKTIAIGNPYKWYPERIKFMVKALPKTVNQGFMCHIFVFDIKQSLSPYTSNSIINARKLSLQNYLHVGCQIHHIEQDMFDANISDLLSNIHKNDYVVMIRNNDRIEADSFLNLYHHHSTYDIILSRGFITGVETISWRNYETKKIRKADTLFQAKKENPDLPVAALFSPTFIIKGAFFKVIQQQNKNILESVINGFMMDGYKKSMSPERFFTPSGTEQIDVVFWKKYIAFLESRYASDAKTL